MGDPVNSPEHYNQGGIECVDALRACLGEEGFKGFLRGNAIKYLWRCQDKGRELEDLKKAEWYLLKMIETAQKERVDG